jgi:uncharacterized protein YbjT (DUF2867 family)
MAINYIEKGAGLHAAIAAAGHRLTDIDGVWVASDEQAVQAIIDAYDPLPPAQEAKISAINAECRSRLFNRFGDPAEQVSRSLGLYGAPEKLAMEVGISATIDASNAASNAVLAALTVAAVEAVTVTWPVI